MPGRLTVCPTPIGNLEDMSPRIRKALGDADLVACEDTRRAGLVFERLEIPKSRFVSYHEGNEAERAVQLAQQVERGAKVALISEAGTPVISDPGYRLLRACIERDLEIEVLPGPSAVITALVASGLPPDRWRFEGFLPRRAGELERVLRSAETVVAFESPRRLPQSLSALATLAPNRPAAVCRELTKLHEEVRRGDLNELAAHYAGDAETRGEFVIVVAPPDERLAEPIDIDTLLRDALGRLSVKEAVAEIAAVTGQPRREVYQRALALAKSAANDRANDTAQEQGPDDA
jgi:16S rRNA (cytidine1402-2'-O)-methyltransferase